MVYIVLFVILATLMFAGSFFVYRGFRMNIARGVRNIFVLLAVTLVSVGTARLFSRDYESLPLSGALLSTIREALTEYGMYNAEMETVLNATVERLTYTLLIAVFFVVLFTIAVVILTVYDHVRKNFRATSFRYRKLANTCFSFLTGFYLILFALFAPPINVAAEAANINNAYDLILMLQDGNFNGAVGSISLITDALMNTSIIAADESARLSLINSAIVAGAARQSDPMVAALLSGLTFTSADDVKREAAKMKEFIDILAQDGITPEMLNQGNFTLETFRQMNHIDELVTCLYSMKSFEPVTRIVLTYGIRIFTGDQSYNYPEDVEITEQSAEDLKTAINLLPFLYESMNKERAGTLTIAQAAEANSYIERLKSLSFMSDEVYKKLESFIGLNG